jgi:hypothetical protein
MAVIECAMAAQQSDPGLENEAHIGLEPMYVASSLYDSHAIL